MTFLELAKKRRSVREYKNLPVEEEKLRQVLEAGRLAPSAGNRQPWYFVVVRDPETRRQVEEAYRAYPNFLKNPPPTFLVVCGDHRRSWRRRDGKDFCDVDVALAVDHMTLAAADVGLGTLWICGFDSLRCHKALNLPAGVEVLAILPLGYGADGMPEQEKDRKPLEDVVLQETFPQG